MLTFKSGSFSDNCAAKNALFPSWVDEGSQTIKRPEKERRNGVTFASVCTSAFLKSSRVAAASVLWIGGRTCYGLRPNAGSTLLVKSHLSFSFPLSLYLLETIGRGLLTGLSFCAWANISLVPRREPEDGVDHNSSNLSFDQSSGLPAGAPNSLRAPLFISVPLSYLWTS